MRGHTEQLCLAYERVFPQLVQSWWGLDLPEVFGWSGVEVEGEPRYFVVARRFIGPGVKPEIHPDQMACALVRRAACRIGWTPRTRAPQILGLVPSTVRLEHHVDQDGILILTGGLGFRVL